MCEAFTSLGPEWEETPFTMKPVADQAFCDGLNKVCVHNFSQSPSLTAKPGYVYCAGTHYNRASLGGTSARLQYLPGALFRPVAGGPIRGRRDFLPWR